MLNNTIFIDGIIGEYNKMGRPIPPNAKYHANEFMLSVNIDVDGADLTDEERNALLEECVKRDGMKVLAPDNKGYLYNFYSKFAFNVEDVAGQYAKSDKIPCLKEGTKVRLALIPVANDYRKSGVHYVVDGIMVEKLTRFVSRFAGDFNREN